MTSTFNSRHNKYVSIPDWFKDVDLTTEKTVETKVTYVGGGGGVVASPTTGLSNITLYNKFVLKQKTSSSDILIIGNTALNVQQTTDTEVKIGDELQVTGWGTTPYIDVAAGSTMTINASTSELYGLVFYDNTKSVISGIGLSSSPIDIVVPNNATYFRISSELGVDTFSIVYYQSIDYTTEQLAQSNSNITDYVGLDETIPEGISAVQFEDTSLKLLVQSPLSLTKDLNNVVKLSVGEIKQTEQPVINDMFVWDKKLAAFGYDSETGTAYSYIDEEQQFTTDEDGNQVPVMTSNPEFWLYDDALEDQWIIKSTRPRISWLENLVEYNNEKNCFIFHGNVLATGGITMYAEEGDTEGEGSGTIPGLDELKKLFVTTDELAQNVVGIKTFENGIQLGSHKLYAKDGIVWLEGNLAVTGGITMYASTGDGEGEGSGGSWLPDNIEALVEKLQNFFVTTNELVQSVTGVKHFENGIYIGNVPVHQSSDGVVYIEGNLLVRGGITMYAQDGTEGSVVDYSNIPIDGDTIYWNTIDGKQVLSAKGGGAVANISTTGSGNAVTSVTLSQDGKTLIVTKGITFPTQNDIDTIENSINQIEQNIGTIEDDIDSINVDINNINDDIYDLNIYIGSVESDLTTLTNEFHTFLNSEDADSTINKWHELEDFLNGVTEQDTLAAMLLLKADKSYVDGNFVTLATEQTITGKKDFTTGGLFVNGKQIIYNKTNKYWKLEGDLLITGGITMYADSSYTASTIMDAIQVDEKTISKKNGYLEYIGATGGGGGVDEDAVRELIESYNYLQTLKTLTINNSSGTALVTYDGLTAKSLTLSKSHVGLSNVENTALSTWSGSSYITKVGTISSGTWNGSTITASYLPTATYTAKGIASFDSSSFTVSSGKVYFDGASVKIVSSLPSSRSTNTLYVITG